MNYVRNKLRQYIAALLPSRIYEQVCPVLSHCLHPHPLQPIRLPLPSGSQLLRLPFSIIELLICYGAKTTAQLLCFYGFEMGAPLPCDVLHVALLMPTLTTSPNNVVAPVVCGCECTSCSAADDARLEFLSKCSLRISDDHGLACSLL